MSPRSARALFITAVSLAAWLGWNHLRVFKHPWGDLSAGNYTDHFSHMNAARAFPRFGIDIWRKSAIELSRPATPAERAAWPADVHPGGSWRGGTYVVDGWPASKPWVTSWPHKPRLYPPGDMLLVAPVALVYHYTSLSLTEANRWLFSLFLIYAHVTICFIVLAALAEKRLAMPLLDLATLTLYVVILFWTLEGFYDAAAMTPLLLCALYLRQRRGLAAAVAYAVALVIHFRVLFLAPWAVYAVWIFVRDGKWRGLRLRDYAAITVGAVCALVSLCTLALVRPVLAQQDVNNSVNIGVPSVQTGPLLIFAAVILVAAVLIVLARSWFDLATLGWLTLSVLLVKEAHAWHVLIPGTWLVAPVFVTGRRRAELVRAARLLVLVHLAARVMVN